LVPLTRPGPIRKAQLCTATRALPAMTSEAVPVASAMYPHIMTVAMAATGGELPTGRGCDEQFEFEFALDLLLDGFERLHRRGWTCTAGRRPGHR